MVSKVVLDNISRTFRDGDSYITPKAIFIFIFFLKKTHRDIIKRVNLHISFYKQCYRYNSGFLKMQHLMFDTDNNKILHTPLQERTLIKKPRYRKVLRNKQDCLCTEDHELSVDKRGEGACGAHAR